MDRFAIVTFLSLSCSALAFGQQHQPEYVYVSSGSTNGFVVNKSTGVMTALPGLPPAVAGDPVATAPTGQFVFFAGTGISVGQIDRPTGSLAAVPGSPFATELNVTNLAVTPNERFLIGASGIRFIAFR